MGSPLGPTFADFYMCQLENTILKENNYFNPSLYVRYVDDIFTIFDDPTYINTFKTKLESYSSLKFTTEIATSNTFNFLDVKLLINDNGFIETVIHYKETDKGSYTNYDSYLPQDYKLAIIKTLVFRAHRTCSNWNLFDLEMKRITQNLINNNFPQYIIEKTINTTLSKLYNSSNPEDNTNSIPIYVRSNNAKTMKTDAKQLQHIIEKTTISKSTKKIKISMYYKPQKLESLFSTRPKCADLSKSNVVYLYQCPEDGCQATYIGYTSNTLQIRANQHRSSYQSKIHEHFTTIHEKLPPKHIHNNFKILYQNSNIKDVKLAECILIKTKKPNINVIHNEIPNVAFLY